MARRINEECKFCGMHFTSSVTYKLHIEREHNLDWIQYLRDYYPEKHGYCVICGKPTLFRSFNEGFKHHCSKECTYKDENFINKKKESYRNLSDEAKKQRIDKAKETNLKKYGVESTFLVKEFKDKAKKTCLEKYGNECYIASDEGKSHSFWSNCTEEDIKKRNKAIADTCLERYGADNPSKSGEVKDRIGYALKARKYEKVIEDLKLFGIQLNETKEEYCSRHVHSFICPIHGEFEAESNGSYIHCPKCTQARQTSSYEKAISSFIREHYHGDVVENSRSVIEGKELDIYLPEIKLAVEFDGLYWHSNQFLDSRYHLQKTLECQKKGIQLIHVFENEWVCKSDIVKSILLSKLGIYSERIYARKCTIREVDLKEERDFLDKSHIQGYVPSSCAYGLYFNDELVEIASFRKSRYRKNEWELLRFCSKLNTQCIGGLGKLIKHFKTLNPDIELVTYCDRRYSDGNGYMKSGWALIHETDPNYFYFRKGSMVLESRLKYQKSKLSSLLDAYDPSLTEKDNMNSNGYCWIYDSGNYKFAYKEVAV